MQTNPYLEERRVIVDTNMHGNMKRPPLLLRLMMFVILVSTER